MKFLGLLSLMVMFVLLPAFAQDEDVSSEAVEESGWKTQQMPFNYQNIQVPREFWENVKNILHEDGVKESIIDGFSVLPVNMQIELFTDDPMVLKGGKNHRLIFIEGGGTSDLFDYVPGKGEFRVRLAPGFPDESPFHILYISDSPGKEVAEDKWGNGCGKIFDLSEKYQVLAGFDGIRVTGARRHYMHLLAGTYVFFQLVEDRLYIGYIRITDSRYPQFNCHQEV